MIPGQPAPYAAALPHEMPCQATHTSPWTEPFRTTFGHQPQRPATEPATASSHATMVPCASEMSVDSYAYSPNR